MPMFCRISSSYDQLRSFFESLAPKCDKLVVYEHSEDVSRIHVHYYAVVPFKYDTMRTYITKFTALMLTKGDWSISEKRTKKGDPVDEGCITYMSKGKLDPVYVKGFTSEELNTYRSLWVDHSSTATPQRITTKQKQVTQYDIAVEVYESVKEMVKEDGEMGYEYYPYYINSAITVLHKYRKAFDEFYLRKIVATAYTMNYENRKSYIQRCVEKFFL